MFRIMEPAREKGESVAPPDESDRLRPLEASDKPRERPYPASTEVSSSPSLAPGELEVLMRTSWKLSLGPEEDAVVEPIAPLIGCRCLGLVRGVVSDSSEAK
jgi:hypothetical protein